VTRADLLRPYLRTDSEILAEVEDAVIERALGLSPRLVRPFVANGVVRIEGEVPTRRARAILLRLVRSVDGVVDVEDVLQVADEPSKAPA
jgi:osmotically-inducible protein OsmY